ncbi:ATP-binding protein [Streptomyces sp. 184]|uniref:ATP-binding protein n=1 Tax=Streptomyces sp. 184 TaxID=1827526 RepID=UPI003892BDCE
MDTMSVDIATLRCATSVAGPRARSRDFLGGLRPAMAAEGAETVVLVVSELVTNALRHGGGACTLELTAHPDSIEVAVHDDSPQPPRMRTPDLNDGTGGFGWPMVNRLARTTAVHHRAGGKTVSALLDRGHECPEAAGARG